MFLSQAEDGLKSLRTAGGGAGGKYSTIGVRVKLFRDGKFHFCRWGGGGQHPIICHVYS